jgi:hypothetical protein
MLAVLSATLDPTYAFFAPLTARVWRRVADCGVVLFLIGSEASWRRDPRGSVVLEALPNGTDIVFVPQRVGVPDYTLAQVVRLCAAALEGAPDDWLVVGDVDLWPVGDSHRAALGAGDEFHVRNADAYGADMPRFPMCYLGGRRRAWRKTFGLDADLERALAAIPWPADGDWHFDERYATARLRAAPDFATHCRLSARPAGTDHGRLDRAAWKEPATLAGLVDAHLPRPGFTDAHWALLVPLLEWLLGSEGATAASAYRTRYVRAGAPSDAELDAWFRLWFRAFAAAAPEPYRSYGGYGNGEPNGTACSVEAIRAFAALVGDPAAVILNAGAGASSFLLRRMFRNVVCVDADPAYLDVVRRICIEHGLSGDGFVVGLERAPDADFTFYDYGEINREARMRYHSLAYRKSRTAVYYDDADDRPHAFPQYRQVVLDFAASQGAVAQDCRAARDCYGRWGVVVHKTAAPRVSGLIAFGLWGKDPLYLRGAVHNIRCAAEHYPTYRVRIYTDDPAALDAAVAAVVGGRIDSIQALAAAAGVPTEIVAMPANVGIRGMFWRFLAASDLYADPILFRDCDSRLNPREAAAVAHWLATGHRFHVMHDHPEHAGWPMLGGMWGVRGGVIADMELRIAAWGVWREKLDDMRFLAAQVWPEARRDLCHHSSLAQAAAAEKFPEHAPWRGFVGEIVPAA